MDVILKFIVQNQMVGTFILVLISMGIYKLLNLQFIKNFFNKRIQQSNKFQDRQISSIDGIQNNYFKNIQQILSQNQVHNQFLKQNVLKQFSVLNSKYDILQRYVVATLQINKDNAKAIQTINQKMIKPYLYKSTSKQLAQIIMDLHIYKKVEYLKSLKSKYKQTIKKQQIIQDIYHVFKQITRSQVELMHQFKCSYGDFSKPLRQILQTKQFQKFVYQQICNCLDKSTQQMINQAIKIMQRYKSQIMDFIEYN